MKPIEFYILGTSVATLAKSEAERRSAVGRIYYGLHHEACCRLFRASGGTSYLEPDGSRHAELIAKYRNAQNNVAQRVGNLLDQLRRLRSTADYDLSNMTYYGDAISDSDLLTRSLRTGEHLLRALEQYSPGEADDGCRCVRS